MGVAGQPGLGILFGASGLFSEAPIPRPAMAFAFLGVQQMPVEAKGQVFQKRLPLIQ